MDDGYERISFAEIYRNPWVAIEVHQIVHPTGVPGEHVLVKVPACAGVVIADDDDLIFAAQARFGAQGRVTEIVKGGAEDGEDALACAQRETREELGIVAARWRPLGFIYEIPSVMHSPVHLFLATHIEHVETAFEAVESIELVRLPREVAFAAVASGRINDAVTAAALLRYAIVTGVLGPALPSPHSTDAPDGPSPR